MQKTSDQYIQIVTLDLAHLKSEILLKLEMNFIFIPDKVEEESPKSADETDVSISICFSSANPAVLTCLTYRWPLRPSHGLKMSFNVIIPPHKMSSLWPQHLFNI